MGGPAPERKVKGESGLLRILSQEEIDALFAGMRAGDPDPAADAGRRQGPETLSRRVRPAGANRAWKRWGSPGHRQGSGGRERGDF